MKGLLLGALVSALLVFIWGFLFWGVLPTADSALRPVPDERAMRATLKAELPETGVYMLPYSDNPSDTEFQTLHTQGPIATIYLRKEGSEPMAPGTLMLGYLHEVAVLFIMGLMLKVTGLPGYGARVTVVFLAGLAGSLFAQLAGPIWWLHPWDMALVNLVYESIAWLLGGLALAGFVKPVGRRDADEM